MQRLPGLAWVLALVLTFAVTSGCDLLNSKDSGSSTPTTPSSSATLDQFAGTFSSTPTTASPSATSCNNLKYTVTPTSATTATITFSATCAGNVAVNGTGTGTLSGSTLNWNAQGTIAQGTFSCPFTFPNGSNTAVPDGTNAVKVTYSGTVCGIPVSGSEVVHKQ